VTCGIPSPRRVRVNTECEVMNTTNSRSAAYTPRASSSAVVLLQTIRGGGGGRFGAFSGAGFARSLGTSAGRAKATDLRLTSWPGIHVEDGRKTPGARHHVLVRSRKTCDARDERRA